VVKPDELEEQAMAWANAIAALDPAAIRATREVAVRSQFRSFDETVGLGVELRKTTQFNR
jgi:enoyl-CoA hydratase/carnithine racemase